MSGNYGYTDDDAEIVSGSNLQFGLNQNVKLTKFEYIDNGGKDGAAGEAIDIVFSIEDSEKGYRRFPIVKAFKNQVEFTDPNESAEAKAAFDDAHKELSSVLVHIVGCFVEKEVIKKALATPFPDFKSYVKALEALLPFDFYEKPLDIFTEYQWSITGENKKTYLRIPKNMKQGRWLSRAVPAVGEWKAVTSSSGKNALQYVDDEGNVHPFTRTKWYMESNFANQQFEDGHGPANTESAAPTKPVNWG